MSEKKFRKLTPKDILEIREVFHKHHVKALRELILNLNETPFNYKDGDETIRFYCENFVCSPALNFEAGVTNDGEVLFTLDDQPIEKEKIAETIIDRFVDWKLKFRGSQVSNINYLSEKQLYNFEQIQLIPFFEKIDQKYPNLTFGSFTTNINYNLSRRVSLCSNVTGRETRDTLLTFYIDVYANDKIFFETSDLNPFDKKFINDDGTMKMYEEVYQFQTRKQVFEKIESILEELNQQQLKELIKKQETNKKIGGR